jgi:spoIIIJ-associated protein
MKEKLETIKELIENTLKSMTVMGEVEIVERDEYFYFAIKTREASILIGEGGQNLEALNHLVKKMSENIIPREERPMFLLDVNEYHQRKVEELKSMARMQAQRVRYFKKEITLDPMTSYERRIIHSALTEYPDIATESTGENPNRRVVIRPLKELV